MKLTREIPRYTQRIAEYQEQTIKTIKDIASDFIEAEKQVIGSFQTQVDRNSGGVWDLYNPQRIAENYAVMVNNFTSYLLNNSNLINNALASNMRVYNTALEQTRDNMKAFAKTNTNYVKAVDRQNSAFLHAAAVTIATKEQLGINFNLVYNLEILNLFNLINLYLFILFLRHERSTLDFCYTIPFISEN